MTKLANPSRYAAVPARCVVTDCRTPVRAGAICDDHAAQLHAALKPRGTRGTRGTRRGHGPLSAPLPPDQTSLHTPVTPDDAA